MTDWPDEAFDLVLTSPMQRARVTADLVGHGDAEVDDDLVEWGYGDYEGRTSAEIREDVPGLDHLDRTRRRRRDARPGGRAPRPGRRPASRACRDRALVFGHGHALRALTARWLGLPVTDGRLFRLDTAILSRLGYERENPVILAWNS